jgi:hypothetical protein
MPVRKAITRKEGVYFIPCTNWLPLFKFAILRSRLCNANISEPRCMALKTQMLRIREHQKIIITVSKTRGAFGFAKESKNVKRI